MSNSLEPRRDLPLHKIPELLAKITGTFSSASNEQFFEHYADRREARLSLEGILRLCDDLAIEPDSYEVLLFCYLCRAKQMYQLTREEFLLGLKHLSPQPVDNLVDLRRALFRYDVRSEEKHFYLWTFHYGLIDGQRALTTGNALSLWRLFYSKQVDRPAILDGWLDFLQGETGNEIPKLITSDTWKIFPQFARFLQTNGFHAYDENEAWPCLFDGFVEDHLKKTNASRMT